MPQKVAIYLVDVSGSMGGQRISGAQKFVKNMRQFYDRTRIYTYGDYGIERDYNTFASMSAGGGTAIEQCLNDMFKSEIPQEKRNLVDFVLLTDAEDSINNLSQLQSNIASCKQQYTSNGGKLDNMATFFLTNGQHNDTSRKIVRAFGSASVFDNATIDKKLKETEQGIRQVGQAETAVKNAKDKIQSQINKAKVAAQKASQNEDAKKRREKLCSKSQNAAEAIKKAIEQTEQDVDKIRDKQKNTANDNKPEPNNNKAESNDNDNNKSESNDKQNDNKSEPNDNDNDDNNNKSESNDKKPEPEPEPKKILETDDADEDGTVMKLFFASKKIFKKLLEKKTWEGLGNKLFNLSCVTDSLDNKKKGQKKFQFTLKFEEDFETIAPSGSERKKRESIYAFKTNVRRALCKRLNIGMNHITTGEPYEGSIYILIIIDRYGVEEFYQKYVVPELDKQFQFIRQQIEEKNPFDINDKTDREIEEEKTKNELISLQNKLQNISNENNGAIDELKQSVVDEEKQLATIASEIVSKETEAAIKQFDDLESMLNNIRVASVQGKVKDMRNNLAKSKNQVLSMAKQAMNQKIDFDKTQINKQFENLKQNTKHIEIVNEKIQKGIEHCENVMGDEIKMRKNKWKDEIYFEFCQQREKAMEEGNKEISKMDKEFKKNNQEIEEMDKEFKQNTRSVAIVSSLSENQEEKKDEKTEVDRIYFEAATNYKDGKNIIEDIENRNNSIVTQYIYGENKNVFPNKFISKLKNGDWGHYELLTVELNGKQNDDEKYDEKKNDEIYILKFDTDFAIIQSDNNKAEKFKHDIKITISKQLSIDENLIHINNVLEDDYDDDECVSVHFTINNVGRRSFAPNLSSSSSCTVSFAPMIEMKSEENELLKQFAIIRAGIEEKHPFDIDNKTEKEIEGEMNKNKLIQVENKFKDILNKNNKIINELKQLNEIEEKQSSVSEAVMNKFNHLETSLNNIQIKWVQPKVYDMKNNLKKTKDEIIIDFEKHKKLGINKTKINELILKLEKNESDIEQFKPKIEKGIDKCLKIIDNELEMRKSKWKKFVDKIFEKHKYGCEFEAMENITHKKNAKLLSMVILTKLNVTITSGTDLRLIVYKNGTNGECKPIGKIELPGNAWILSCSKDEKYLIAACANKGKDGLIIIWNIPSNNIEDMHIKYYIESKKSGTIRFRTPNAIAISNDNRYIFYCQNGAKISVIDLKLNKKKAKKIGEIGLVDVEDIYNGDWIITSISVSDNLLIFGSEHGTIGVFFLCLLQKPLKRAKSIKKFKSRKRTLSRIPTTMNFDFDNMYFAINLFQSAKQIIEDITISSDEKSVVVCGRRRIQCLNIVLKKQTMNNLMTVKKSEEQLKIMKEIIKLEENAKIVHIFGKQARFNKKKPNIFCYCKDGLNGVTFKVYNMNNNGSMLELVAATTRTGKKSSFGSQIQFMDKNNMCVIGYQTITNTYNGKIYNPPKCYVWKYKNKM